MSTGITQVVVLRPEGQADALLSSLNRMWKQRTGTPPDPQRLLHVPAIRIEPVAPDDGTTDRHLAFARRSDVAVFTSPNAVRYSPQALLETLRSRRIPAAAPGAGTARALEAAGLPEVHYPDGRADSEGLLDEPVLARMTGGRVMIATGIGGRGRLAEGLRSRGVDVLEWPVYRRVRPPAEDLEARLDALHPPECAILVTSSAEALQNFRDRVDARTPRWLERVTVVCPGQRLAAAAREMGADRIVLAGSPYEHDLTEAVAACLGSAAPPGRFAEENSHE